MERHELERWLCGPDVPPNAPAFVAAALGLPSSIFADTTFSRTASRVCSLRFTLAVLHDAFPDDADVTEWLSTPHDVLNGCSPTTALLAGRCAIVEMLAVQAWNDAACLFV
jgi:hypothetical protein